MGLRSMGLRSTGPSTAHAGTECSPGNAASSSAEAAPAFYSLPAGGAAIQEASREGIDSPTPLRQSHSCSRPNHPQLQKATGQGMGCQRQIGQSPQTTARDDNQRSHDYRTGSHTIPTRPSFKAWMPDPAMIASKYCSSRWRRDLEHVLKVYYKHTVQTPFRESEWAQARELFFDRFIPKKAEALVIKEESPLEYMPFIAEEFHRATGLRLHDLPEFTLWVKRGSYFHGLLVEQGQIQECPHLIGTPLPRWPQPKPSESREESYR